MSPPWLVAVLGPTGAGKTVLAEELARRLGAQLVAADAFQVYRGLDIGTNKPEPALYEMVDILDPHEPFGAGAYVRIASGVLARCFAQGRSAVVVGGTGLYVRALFEGYRGMHAPPPPWLRAEIAGLGLEEASARLRELDPAAEVDWANPARVRRALERALAPAPVEAASLPPFRRTKLALVPERVALWEAVERRTRRMFEEGWVEEVRRLLDQGVPKNSHAFRAIGYQSVARIVCGEISQAEAEAEITAATRRYAKRQCTWLRTEPGLCDLGFAQPLEGAGATQAADEAMRRLSQEGEAR